MGKNKKKQAAMSGVLAVTFLRSREMAEETYQAMVLRGFEGEYQKKKSKAFCKRDLFRLLILILATVLFISLY